MSFRDLYSSEHNPEVTYRQIMSPKVIALMESIQGRQANATTFRDMMAMIQDLNFSRDEKFEFCLFVACRWGWETENLDGRPI